MSLLPELGSLLQVLGSLLLGSLLAALGSLSLGSLLPVLGSLKLDCRNSMFEKENAKFHKCVDPQIHTS